MKKLAIFLMSIIAFPSFADWQLNKELSTLSFTSVKKEHIAENHHFEQLDASITKNGNVTLTIDLASVNTNIPIRDQRMKEHLFNTAMFPKATFSSQLSSNLISQLAIGQSEKHQIKGKVDLHGHVQEVSAAVLLTKISDNKLLVVSLKPLLINASQYSLVVGINKLRELAKLPSIGQTVPVSFALSFTHQ